MIKSNLMKRVSVGACAAIMLISSMSMVFASTDNPQTVPAHINVPATAIDFTITEKINMVGTANSNDLTIDSLEVTNNNNIGVLNIDSVQATAVEGWTIAAQDTDFTKLGADAKNFSMIADSTHDMSTGAYTAAGQVDPKATDTTTFTGKTGIVTTAIDDTKVADVVVTVSVA